jgi:hypothetical protein
VNVIGVLGLSVIVVLVALWIMPRNGGSRQYLVISTLPLVLTMVIPVPFALAVRGPTDWARQTVLAISRVGVALSFILFAIGAVLTLRAALAGDRQAAALFALETVLAGVPAGIVTVYAVLFRLL